MYYILKWESVLTLQDHAFNRYVEFWGITLTYRVNLPRNHVEKIVINVFYFIICFVFLKFSANKRVVDGPEIKYYPNAILVLKSLKTLQVMF